jgi:hypothetical protein
MKIRICLLGLMLLSLCVQPVYAQEYGKIRAMQQRAAYVVKQKNDFVKRVLTSYAIPHELNAHGVVVRLGLEGRWVDVTAIEIVPVFKEAADKRQYVTAHELFFYTPEGILDLASELMIRP